MIKITTLTASYKRRGNLEGSFQKDSYGNTIDKGPERARKGLGAITKASTTGSQFFWVYKAPDKSVIFSQAKRHSTILSIKQSGPNNFKRMCVLTIQHPVWAPHNFTNLRIRQDVALFFSRSIQIFSWYLLFVTATTKNSALYHRYH